MFLAAMDMLKDQGMVPAFNLKVVLDGEEERGSRQLPAAVQEYKDLLAADHMIINDGPVHLSGPTNSRIRVPRPGQGCPDRVRSPELTSTAGTMETMPPTPYFAWRPCLPP